MPNHPNRSKANRSTSSTPKPAEIRAARESRGLTTAQAAAVVHTGPAAWERWEAGIGSMHPAFFELFLLKTEGNRP